MAFRLCVRSLHRVALSLAVTLLWGCAAPTATLVATASAKLAVPPPVPRVDGVDVSKVDYAISGARFQFKDGTLNTKATPTADQADRVGGAIAWHSLMGEGRKFSYVRISYGDSAVLEPVAKRNWDEAKAAGLDVGPYHYFIPSAFKEKVVRQAQHFLASFEAVERDPQADFLPLALDLEDRQDELLKLTRLQPAAYRLAICTWLDVVKNSPRFRDREIILYVDPDFYATRGLKDDKYCGLGAYRVWLANPFVADAARFWSNIEQVCEPKGPMSYGKCIFVQHSGTYQTSAVPSGILDLNWFIGDEGELKLLMKPTTLQPSS